MVYIYDIILNLNKEIFEFFEWEDDDNIKYVKKIPLFKISSSDMKNLICFNIKIDNSFLNEIKNKSDYYNNDNLYSLAVFTDLDVALAIAFKDNTNFLFSRLLLDEEFEVINIGSKIDEYKLKYEVTNTKDKNLFLTRKEKYIRNILYNEVNDLYSKKKFDKLKYLYFEYFNNICEDVNTLYNDLLCSLNEINENHFKLLEIIKMTNK